MTSNINPIYPQAVAATTASVRANFAAAAQEIESLQLASPVGSVLDTFAAPDPPSYLECNGQTVERATYPALSPLFPDIPYALTEGVLPGSYTWPATAWNGSVFCAIAVSSAVAAISPDGVAWTQQALPVSAAWSAIAWNGSVFCAIAANGTIAATSPDGVTWTQQVLPISAAWSAIAWNGSVFCAIAANGTIAATSPDGAIWTQQALPASVAWSAIAWGNGIFCAVADGGQIAATSPDGAVWTQQDVGFAGNWKAIAYNGWMFLAVGAGSNVLASTEDGAYWWSNAVAWTTNTYSVASLVGGFVFSDPDGGGVMFSLDGSTPAVIVAGGGVLRGLSTDDTAIVGSRPWPPGSVRIAEDPALMTLPNIPRRVPSLPVYVRAAI